jgi:hypothetical protein
MTLTYLSKALTVHYIDHCVQDGRIWALDAYSVCVAGEQWIRRAEWIDVTDISKRELMDWLGY